MESWIGQQLGPYELQSKLGAGGMGVVYRAIHRRLGQARAIKVLPAALAHDETFLQRFEREARLSSELRHPNIVMIFDIAEDHGVNYIVMELLDGRSLHEVIRKDGPLPLERAVVLLRQLAQALDFAHARGVVHRDIKPGNALVSDTDHLTLVDFGIARAAEGTRLTEASSRIGTAEYMAPESITDGDSGSGTDLYALGVIAFEMLTGRVPFTGVNSQTIMYAQIHTPPPSPRTFRTDLSPAVERVVLRQLDKDPMRRYPTAQAFVAALEQARLGLAAGEGTAPTAAGSGYQPTALLDPPLITGQPPTGSPRPATNLSVPGTAASGPGAGTPPRGTAAPRLGRAGTGASVQTPRPGSATAPGNGRAAALTGTGRAPVPRRRPGRSRPPICRRRLACSASSKKRRLAPVRSTSWRSGRLCCSCY
jgi:serine/threonine protein kinase